jgi:hypothetical protein
MEVSGQLHAPVALPPGKSPWPGGCVGPTQSRSGCGSEEKNFPSLSGLQPPIIQLVVQRYTIELSRLIKENTVHCNNILGLRSIARPTFTTQCFIETPYECRNLFPPETLIINCGYIPVHGLQAQCLQKRSQKWWHWIKFIKLYSKY